MDRLECMRAFVAVVEANGFSSAARKSTLSKALLSKYVAQLENELGTRLLQRTTRHVSPTEVGRAYYERCLPLLEELDELESVVKDSHAAPSGELRISAAKSFAELHLMNVVSKFSQQYPKIRINMMLTDKEIDIVEEGIDLAIRIGDLADSSLVARRLGTIHIVVCASPEYLQQRGEPRHPDDLCHHQCIVDTNFRQGADWHFERNAKKFRVSVHGSHYVNSAVAIRELVINHNGIAISPLFVIGADVKAGRVKIILQEYGIQAFGLYAIYSHRRHLSAKVRLFIDNLVTDFATHF
ncbi:MAG: LysR family transcriptional regulator [Thiohalomonadales bacterium]